MKRRGFTLAEVLLALGLGAVALLAALSLGAVAVSNQRKSIDLSAAYVLADSELQRCIYEAGSSAGDPLWAHHDAQNPLRAYERTSGATVYRLGLYVTDAAPPSATKLKKLDLRVHWWDERPGYGWLHAELTRTLQGP
jgi:prepilin-type N-terminal cleavage/methylation domain-containing protein